MLVVLSPPEAKLATPEPAELEADLVACESSWRSRSAEGVSDLPAKKAPATERPQTEAMTIGFEFMRLESYAHRIAVLPDLACENLALKRWQIG